MVDGAVTFYEQGGVGEVPEAVREKTAEYRDDVDRWNRSLSGDSHRTRIRDRSSSDILEAPL